MALQAQALQVSPLIRASLSKGNDVVNLIPFTHTAFASTLRAQRIIREERRAQLGQVAPTQSLATGGSTIELANSCHWSRVGEQSANGRWNETRQAILRDVAFTVASFHVEALQHILAIHRRD